MPGFGTDPDVQPKWLRADEPPPSTADDLHAIRLRFCGPKTMQPTPFSFAANQGLRYDLTGTAVNAIILTTMTGQVNGYLGDNTAQLGKAATYGCMFVGSAAVVPSTEVIPIAPATDYIFTLQEGAGGTTTGTITFVYQ